MVQSANSDWDNHVSLTGCKIHPPTRAIRNDQNMSIETEFVNQSIGADCVEEMIVKESYGQLHDPFDTKVDLLA